jgi:uracil-DNA glycosylase
MSPASLREGRVQSKSTPVSAGESPQTYRRCDLWRHATQAVEGEGSPSARIMLVGEQPGERVEELRATLEGDLRAAAQFAASGSR